MDLKNQHELHAIAIAGATYGITRNVRATAIIGIGMLTYMSLFGHGLPFDKNEDTPPMMTDRVIEKKIHHDLQLHGGHMNYFTPFL